MKQACAPFAGKNITLLGLGLLGRGVGDAVFLASCGAQVIVTDKKSAEELAESVARLKESENITFHLGGHVRADFTHADLVVKAAGVRLDSPEIAAAREAGVPVVMSTALFAKYAMEGGATIVGVTGTRGKSTVTQMIFHTLTQAGRRVHLGGNVRGVSTLALLPEVEAGDIVVLELDSWQLQGFGDLHISPQIAVFTNLMPDHQNYYPDMETYFSDKANIFMNQKAGDVLVVGAGIVQKVLAARLPEAAALRVPEPLASDWRLQVPGEHNRENASLACAALAALGMEESIIRRGLESFAGVEGRLQLVREVAGIQIYNDNNATTPEATIAALKALDTGKKNIVLIMGGADKKLDMNGLLYEISHTCKRTILLAGSGTDRVVPLMSDYSVYDNLAAAVSEACRAARAGDIILFSPAFASFGMFANEYDRNDRFIHIVSGLDS